MTRAVGEVVAGGVVGGVLRFFHLWSFVLSFRSRSVSESVRCNLFVSRVSVRLL